jgi:hypothetical protein
MGFFNVPRPFGLLISLNIRVHLINIYDTSSNNNVDIKFSAHDAFLEQPLSGTLKIETLIFSEMSNTRIWVYMNM